MVLSRFFLEAFMGFVFSFSFLAGSTICVGMHNILAMGICEMW
uniref:Uncharacterized protein n=1 Tax=Rhizophora mucronata TaxID=61149 RepID=A0A2P2QEY2_RHIMU